MYSLSYLSLIHIQSIQDFLFFIARSKSLILLIIIILILQNEDRLTAELKESRANYDKLVAYTTEKLALAQKEVENSQTEFSNKEGTNWTLFIIFDIFSLLCN